MTGITYTAMASGSLAHTRLPGPVGDNLLAGASARYHYLAWYVMPSRQHLGHWCNATPPTERHNRVFGLFKVDTTETCGSCPIYNATLAQVVHAPIGPRKHSWGNTVLDHVEELCSCSDASGEIDHHGLDLRGRHVADSRWKLAYCVLPQL